MGDLTDLLTRWSAGDAGAAGQLFEAVQDELRQIARNLFKKEPENHTLQPTALVNELYLKLAAQRRVSYENHQQFFAVAARIMRRFLVDHARRRRARGRALRVTLTEAAAAMECPATDVVDLLALEAALRKLAADHPREHEVVELRYFGGLSVEDTAEVLGVSRATVKRDFRFARSYLFQELREGGADTVPG